MESKEDIMVLAEQLEDDLEDVKNIIHLLEMSLESNQDDEHIIKSVSIIHKMVSAVIEKRVVELKETVLEK